MTGRNSRVGVNLAIEGQGGKGGDAKVGGNGIAIGGPGGHGDGGGGEVPGDGIVAGGEGGSAGDDNVWRPPARSGYEVYMEQTGQTPNPLMKQFGRGGSVLANINDVPLDHLNQTLEAMN